MEGLGSTTEQAPDFQRSELLDSILQPKYHHFSQNCSWLHPSITQDRSNGTQYTPPNKFPSPVKVTDLGNIQSRFLFTCLLFKGTGFPCFELLYYKNLFIQILVNLILESGLVMLQSFLISYDMLYIIPYCHCSALFHLTLA